jgi:GNAT superfamily N-acetyltransferase
MQFKKTEQTSRAIKITAEEDGKVLGRSYLYIIKNDLHPEPYGFMEDVFVEESARGGGLGGELVKQVIEEAKDRGCYKLICTSRDGRDKLHEWYEKMGFRKHGSEFRVDLIV